MKTKTYNTFEGPKQAILKDHCVVCGSALYVWDGTDHSGDPRGAIKENNNYDPLVASEYDMAGPDIPACFACMNTQELYTRALAIAKSKWE